MDQLPVLAGADGVIRSAVASPCSAGPWSHHCHPVRSGPSAGPTGRNRQLARGSQRRRPDRRCQGKLRLLCPRGQAGHGPGPADLTRTDTFSLLPASSCPTPEGRTGAVEDPHHFPGLRIVIDGNRSHSQRPPEHGQRPHQAHPVADLHQPGGPGSAACFAAGLPERADGYAGVRGLRS